MNGFGLRARIFLPVFGVACIASLGYVFSRPSVFQSSARLQIDAPQGQRLGADADASPGLVGAVQTLTSRGMLEGVVKRLASSSPAAAGTIGAAHALEESLSATPVAGTNVIELRAEGGERGLLPRILATWIDVYRQSNSEAHDQSSSQALTGTRAEIEQAQQSLAAKRRELDAFRKKYDIVSLEREENQSMSRLKGLNAAANDARNREVAAESRLNSIRENAAAGRSVRPPGDKVIIADLEKRALDLREKMKDLENDFTPQYLAIEPKYKALQANLKRAELQIEREQQASAQQALQTAEEELAGARQAVLRLQKDLAARKQEAQEFTSRFAEHTALVGELGGMELAYSSAKARLVLLEGERRVAGPKVTVLSQPSIPDRPLRPDYLRDALLGIACSGVLGVLAVWFLEFFRRSGLPQPAPVMQPPTIQIALAPGAEAFLPAIGATALRLPETVAQMPRELTGPEIHALWAAAAPDSRQVIASLLGGRAPPADVQGVALSSAAVEGLITCAACDAGLANPTEVTASTLRHTYLAYLVRQGARLADIGRVFGHVAAAELREYGRLSPAGPGLPLEQIDPVFPALRPLLG